MKLILTHEVSNLGEPGDIVDVKDGYGRNYLLPRQFAIRWTKGAAKQVESIKAGRDARAVHDL
ncbi:MAG: 50S ribosomal protein L9, partial [Aeromicrobium sp.]